MKLNKFFQIAIDGPVAAGKGTVAKKLASQLHFLYVDTGAMYRAAAFLALKNNLPLDLAHQEEFASLLQKAKMHLQNITDENGELKTLVSLNGEDISDQIRLTEISQAASKSATLPKIREVLVKKQQNLAKKFNVVMEGRDIGLRVLPQAQLKLYLTADLEERVRRRFEQNKDLEKSLDYEAVKKNIEERDYWDMNRETDPLTIVPDAIVLDTTHLNIDQVVANIAGLVKARR